MPALLRPSPFQWRNLKSGATTAALNGVIDAADRSTPVLGYTVSYAISSVLLTFLGPVIVFTA
jgi:hypothetical protein